MRTVGSLLPFTNILSMNTMEFIPVVSFPSSHKSENQFGFYVRKIYVHFILMSISTLILL